MLYAIVAVIALILDQAVKYWTSANIVLNTGVRELIPGVIHLANVHNTGAAFSFLEGARWFFVALCVVFTAAVIVLLVKNVIQGRWARWMAVIVLAGAVGNCIDRIICGYVVDMFEFEFLIFGRSFPVFNVADIFITVGGIIFCLCVLFEDALEGRKEKTAEKAVTGAERKAVPAAENKTEARSEHRTATEEPARVRRSAGHRRGKLEIPEFPKHEAVPMPAVDPNDPFAEWERAAAAHRSQTKEQRGQDDSAARLREEFAAARHPQARQPQNPAAPVQPAEEQRGQDDSAARLREELAAARHPQARQPQNPAAPVQPAKEQCGQDDSAARLREELAAARHPQTRLPQNPAAPVQPAAARTDELSEDYDLDSILNEFRDL